MNPTPEITPFDLRSLRRPCLSCCVTGCNIHRHILTTGNEPNTEHNTLQPQEFATTLFDLLRDWLKRHAGETIHPPGEGTRIKILPKA